MVPRKVKSLYETALTNLSECGEDETLCVHTSEVFVQGLKTTPTTPDIPTDEVPVIHFTLLFRAKGAIISHAFVVAKENNKYYLVDSWEGIHPFLMREIPISWFSDFKALATEMSQGHLRHDSFVKVFGTWEEEKAKLKANGYFVNDYPRDNDFPQVIKFSVKRTGYTD